MNTAIYAAAIAGVLSILSDLLTVVSFARHLCRKGFQRFGRWLPVSVVITFRASDEGLPRRRTPVVEGVGCDQEHGGGPVPVPARGEHVDPLDPREPRMVAQE